MEVTRDGSLDVVGDLWEINQKNINFQAKLLGIRKI